MTKYIATLVLSCFSLLTCTEEQSSRTLAIAEDNAGELQDALSHFCDNESLSYAAKFLLDNMYDKEHENELYVAHYDPYFRMLVNWKSLGLKGEKDIRLQSLWDSLVATTPTYGKSKNMIPDAKSLSSQFIIENVERAFLSWHRRPSFSSDDYEDFLEYVLPYKVSYEVPRLNRSYYNAYCQIRDTASSPRQFLKDFKNEFYYKRGGRKRGNLLSFPFDIPMDRLEMGLLADCHQNAIFCISVIRALGIPVALDMVKAWGNRSSGHEWCALLLKNGHFYPFNPFEYDSTLLEYKPAKIFRRKYSVSSDVRPDTSEVPSTLISQDLSDVTNLYGKTYNITIPIKYSSELARGKVYGLICVFDNKDWIPVWYGRNSGESMFFNNMMGDVVYIAAIYHHGKIIPTSDPFVLTSKGDLSYLNVCGSSMVKSMHLLRKYTYFSRMNTLATQLRSSTIEGSNDRGFNTTVKLAHINFTPYDTAEIQIETKSAFRYLRCRFKDQRLGNLAEISFWGIGKDGIERELNGKIIGAPSLNGKEETNGYTAAMDKKYETYFCKKSGEVGYVGLDLGVGKKFIPTKVRLYPRSDTNYIIPGDEYELLFWNDGRWESVGRQVARCHHLDFKEVPSGTLYWLRNLTKGKEERIFTYEEGKQVWW